MKIGTKSLLFGAHQFLFHPLFVAWAWFKLYGFRTVIWRVPTYANPMKIRWWDPCLWMCFIIHDWGYWGCADMDGKEGPEHPYVAADLASKHFPPGNVTRWHWFLLLHSRYTAGKTGCDPSPLAAADKMSLGLMPWWIYIPVTRMTGEIREYQSIKRHFKDTSEYGYIEVIPAYGQPSWELDRLWFRIVSSALTGWAVNFVEKNNGFRV